LLRILHWRPKLGTADSHRNTAAVPESVGVVVVLVLLLESRPRSSHDNLPASSRGLPGTLHWRPNLRNSDYRRSMALAEGLVSSLASSGAAVTRVPSGAVAWTETRALAYSSNRSRTLERLVHTPTESGACRNSNRWPHCSSPSCTTQPMKKGCDKLLPSALRTHHILCRQAPTHPR